MIKLKEQPQKSISSKQRHSALSTQRSALITYAAGGILWRTTKKGREVLLIYRPENDDWTLPKGHVETTDAGWDAAALREIKEETGYDAQITAFAGFTSYKVKGKPKVVLFWHMKPVGKQQFEPSDEVGATKWFPLADAIAQLTYEKDQVLMQQFVAGATN